LPPFFGAERHAQTALAQKHDLWAKTVATHAPQGGLADPVSSAELAQRHDAALGEAITLAIAAVTIAGAVAATAAILMTMAASRFSSSRRYLRAALCGNPLDGGISLTARGRDGGLLGGVLDRRDTGQERAAARSFTYGHRIHSESALIAAD
jgi:hypothetical protein